MRAHIINFVISIIFGLVIIIANYKKSGGDIFVQLMIVGFALLQTVIVLITRIFVKFNYLKIILWIFGGLVISYGMFLIANFFATK